MAIIVLAAVAVLADWLDPPLPPVAGIGQASDGDSFRLGADRVRLLGLDAPELNQHCATSQDGRWPCGRVARDRMAGLLASGSLQCQPEGHDRYGRLLAHCTIDGSDLGAIMVAEGLAVAAAATPANRHRHARQVWASGPATSTTPPTGVRITRAQAACWTGWGSSVTIGPQARSTHSAQDYC
tara:strand:+ start:19414 stop:19962 length:549 start_codon:yes stop_codon:yes gene_type:complete